MAKKDQTNEAEQQPQQPQKPTNLTEAIIAVMQQVKNIEKNMEVGTGQNSYKGVSDKDVKNIIGKAMADSGLVLLPIRYTPKIQIDRWEESTNYGVKTKQSVFTELIGEYELRHVSGEKIILQGYGHGVDSQDKSAGKASTYALKNLLLYTFLVPTGTLEDTDNTHSNELPQPQAPIKPKTSTPIPETPRKDVLKKFDEAGNITPRWANLLQKVKAKEVDMIKIETYFTFNSDNEKEEMQQEINNANGTTTK